MSKKTWVTAGLLQFVRLLTGGKLLKEIKELVSVYFDDDSIAGTDKKALITDELNDVKSELYGIVKGMSGWVISVAIDVVYAYIMARQDKDK